MSTHDGPDSGEVALIRETMVRLVESTEGPSLTAGLDEFGWLDVLSSHPDVAIPALFEAAGRRRRWSAALHDVAAVGLEGITSIRPSDVCVVLPRPRRWATAASDGDVVRVEGLVLGPRTTRTAYVVARVEGAEVVDVVQVPADALQVISRRGLDAGLGASEVSGVVVNGTSLLQGSSATAWWTAAEAVTRVALCHYLVGSLRTMLELARDHAVERRQFGQPIGTFQAVRHKLAEAFVAVEAAEAAAAAAWEAYDDFPLAAATAKVVASNSVSIVARHAQQVLAGIGFTEEHPFHLSMKRVVVLDRVLGDATDLVPWVGRALVRHGGAPRLVEL